MLTTLKPCILLWLLSAHLCFGNEAETNMANVSKNLIKIKNIS